jgi:DNA invertase Pin-like site-specific DNA recombinase
VIFQETASGARTDRAQLAKAIAALRTGDRLARSTRDLLNTLDIIARKGASFRSLADTWADTTTAHGRLLLTVLGGLAEFERDRRRSTYRRPTISMRASMSFPSRSTIAAAFSPETAERFFTSSSRIAA